MTLLYPICFPGESRGLVLNLPRSRPAPGKQKVASTVIIGHKRVMLVLIDNYDSFTYNLVQYFGDLQMAVKVVRNDALNVDGVFALNPKGIVISPGPSDPDHAGICLDIVKACTAREIPLLGVCLGHQAIGQALGGRIVQTAPKHGKTDSITHNGQGIFKSLPSPLTVTRYHSLVIERESCPADLEITAETGDGIIMGIQHKTLPIHGVQFHPESIATDSGHDLLKNFCGAL